MWEYNKADSVPVVVLKTRRSLRAVHFQPHGVPYLLTAEVRSFPFLHLFLVPLAFCTCPASTERQKLWGIDAGRLQPHLQGLSCSAESWLLRCHGIHLRAAFSSHLFWGLECDMS